MPIRRHILACFLLSFAAALAPRPAHAAVNAAWTTPATPFKIADGLYYVGSQDLAAYLITTPAGDILLNANYTSSPPQIRRGVEALGFHWHDIRILLISHAHVDHAGGAAQILRETGAQFDVMQGDVDVMESGGATDFAFGHEHGMQFPRAHVTRTLHDGDQVSLGGVTLVAHRTPGHTRGCTTWTMQVHVPGEPAGTRRNVVIMGSWSVLSDYRLVATPGKPASYPGIADDYAHTFAVASSLPCDIFLGSHASFFNMAAKLKRMPTEGDRVWIDPAGYRQAIAAGKQSFEETYRHQLQAARHGARQP